MGKEWPEGSMLTLFDDLRCAVRGLSKSPIFAVTSILTLALGIGAVTAVFSVVNSVILRPYSFRDPGRLVIWRETIQEVSNRYPFRQLPALFELEDTLHEN